MKKTYQSELGKTCGRCQHFSMCVPRPEIGGDFMGTCGSRLAPQTRDGFCSRWTRALTEPAAQQRAHQRNPNKAAQRLAVAQSFATYMGGPKRTTLTVLRPSNQAGTRVAPGSGKEIDDGEHEEGISDADQW